MNKMTIYEDESNVKLRYTLINNEPWFSVKEISKELAFENPNSLKEYINDEDIKTVESSNVLNKPESVDVINLYALSQAVSMSMAKKNNSGAVRLKHAVFGKIIPSVIKTGIKSNELSPEDAAILGIVHSKTDTEKATYISKFKDAIINCPEKKKIDIPENKAFSIRSVTENLKLKNGQLTNWLLIKGFLKYDSNGKNPYIDDSGLKYLTLYDKGTSRRNLGITEEGLSYIESYINDVVATPARISKRGELNGV